MYDAGKIITGLIIFIVLVSFPVWYLTVSQGNAASPQLEIVTEAELCVEPVSYMRANHMDLLTEWQTSTVRENERTYTASDGQEYDISLTGTCLSCHPNKAEFCDRCHDYAGVKPYCWDCHIIPEGD